MTYTSLRPEDSFSVQTMESELESNIELSEQTNGSNQPKSADSDVFAAWISFFLRPGTLFIFAACYVAIAIFLAALGVYSHTQHGFAATDHKFYYLCTYAPTAGEPTSVNFSNFTQV